MAETKAQKNAREILLESVVELGTKAFDPQVSPASREPFQEQFHDLIER